ncbi:MAG: 2Fe-2S iron-sulfur cluster binding domain-containing protein [Clostridia bacterium]|nr:2Fe-2S iron-sulfur cluster binding domain-containing protein [Clostridia bacterium]
MEILTTVLSVTVISVSLAIIIIIAEYFFNNYGECEIDINNGDKILKVEGGSSLLSTLAAQKIFIPSACGGKATCGLCKAQVIEGAGPLLPTEEPYLSAEDRNNNYRLSCQVKVKNNIRIIIPEEFFNIKEYITTIEKIEQLTHDIKGLRLNLPEGETIKFKAGQYMQLYTKPYGKIKESVYRAYSIANAPSDNTAIELIIRQVPDGICTTYVHTQLSENDNVKINGPYGDFYLRGNCDEIIMIAGGSGMAPIKSIILDVLEKGIDIKMNFFFGAVTKRDLYNLDYFENLAANHANFRFIPALSKPAPEDNWKGEVGLITDVVARNIDDGSKMEGYLCGSPGMIKACINVLNTKGITEDKIYYDKF